MAKIHSSALVSPHAELADDVTVDAFTIIEDDVQIGAGCQISSGVRLHSGVRLGQRVKIGHASAIGGEPQDLKFGGEKTEVFVSDDTVIREFCTISRGTKATMKTTVGKNCFLMAYTHIAHDCVIGNNVILANVVTLAGHVEIEDFAILGGIVPVHQFVRIGQHCMIGGGLRIPKDVPPYIMAGGQPTRYYGLNSVGLRRRGFSTETRAILKRAYQILFQSELNTMQAVERIEQEFGSVPEVRNILNFVAKSKRGLLPGHRFANREQEQEEV